MGDPDVLEIIEINNKIIIDELNDFYKNRELITIVGKGESAKYISYGIAINQSLLFTNKKVVFMNDFESCFGIEQYLKDIQYLFIPYYPHIKCKAHPDFTYVLIQNYANKYGFKGKIFVYQLSTTFNKNILKDYFLSAPSTTGTAILFFHKFLQKTFFEFYGVSKGVLYHPHLLQLDFSTIKENNLYQDLFDKYIPFFLSNFNYSLQSCSGNHDRFGRFIKKLKSKNISLTFY